MAKRLFNAADTDKDHILNQKEFFALSHPQNYAHMHKLAVDQRLAEYDQDGDKKFTLEEFHAAGELTHISLASFLLYHATLKSVGYYVLLYTK